MIQDIEAAEAARQTAALERQRRESMLCEAMEQHGGRIHTIDPAHLGRGDG